MTAVLVDSNVLLDVFSNDPVWSEWSRDTLAETADHCRLVINPVIYSEVSVRFSRIEDLEQALPAATFQREPIPFEAAFLAGKVFRLCRERGGAKAVPLPDFFIGAHAAVARYQLLTRDTARYRTYFVSVRLISP